MSRFSHRLLKMVGLLAVLFSIPFLVFAESMHSSGPLDGRTGAPGEGLCTDCHSGSPDDGSVQITGTPMFYEPGATYTITVTLQDQGQSRWGFELTAKDGSANGAGDFTITDAVNTQLSDNPAPAADYVKHTSAGTYNGTPDGPVTWEFDWTAPPSDVGDITFYVAGNAADGNSGTSGDNIYTSSFTSKLDEVPSASVIGLLVLTLLLATSSVFVLRRRRLRLS